MPTLLDAPTAAWILLFARLSIALVFVVSAVHKAIWYQKAVEEFTDDGVPLIGISLPGTILLHFVGAICLILGIYTEPAGLLLAIHTLAATYMVHGFWRFEGIDRLIRSRVFLANLGVVGGLLYIAVLGPGPLALS
ncbi:MAG: DoxX family protein [Woeseiaceae bacterium]